MSETSFVLAYDGPAVADGEMEIADLAPALLSLGQLLNAAAKAIDGEKAKVSIKVKSTQEGSFEIWLSVAMDMASTGWTWWKSDDVQAAAQLVSLLGLSGASVGVSLVKLVRFLRGRKPEKVVRRDPATVEIFLDATSTIVVPIAIYHLAMDPQVRSGLAGVVADPLDKDGIDVVRFGPKGNATEIPKEEAFAFRAPIELDGDVLVNRYRRAFSIVSLSFKDGQKWRLNDGHGAKPVRMSDKDFEDQVNRNEVRFAKGDVLICEVIERASITSKGLKSEYEIIKVLDHQEAPSQPPLPDM
ncbi:MAG: hypothetical protein ACKOOL_03615 [Novosphingobium sp.]